MLLCCAHAVGLADWAALGLLLQRNEAAAKEGRPLEYIWRRLYVPEKGMLCDPPKDLQLGTRLPEVGGGQRTCFGKLVVLHHSLCPRGNKAVPRAAKLVPRAAAAEPPLSPFQTAPALIRNWHTCCRTTAPPRRACTRWPMARAL